MLNSFLFQIRILSVRIRIKFKIPLYVVIFCAWLQRQYVATSMLLSTDGISRCLLCYFTW